MEADKVKRGGHAGMPVVFIGAEIKAAGTIPRG
jgi:hypothetical protein